MVVPRENPIFLTFRILDGFRVVLVLVVDVLAATGVVVVVVIIVVVVVVAVAVAVAVVVVVVVFIRSVAQSTSARRGQDRSVDPAALWQHQDCFLVPIKDTTDN